MACHLAGAKVFSEPMWNIVNQTIRDKCRWNVDQNLNIFIQENAFENVIWKMAALLSRSQCINEFDHFDIPEHIFFSNLFKITYCYAKFTSLDFCNFWKLNFCQFYLFICLFIFLYSRNLLETFLCQLWGLPWVCHPPKVIFVSSALSEGKKGNYRMLSLFIWCKLCRCCNSVTTGQIHSKSSSLESSWPVDVKHHGHLPIVATWACPRA